MTAKTTGSPASKAGSKAAQDAITLLVEDHKEVTKLFKAFDKAAKAESVDEKEELAEQICLALKVHTEIEEEIFYPALRAAIDDDDMLNEAEVEHASAKDLIAQIEAMASSDPMYDAKVTVLSEYIEHHVKEEESEMFPKAKKAKLDLDLLGEQMSERKEELTIAMEGGASPGVKSKRTNQARGAAR